MTVIGSSSKDRWFLSTRECSTLNFPSWIDLVGFDKSREYWARSPSWRLFLFILDINRRALGERTL